LKGGSPRERANAVELLDSMLPKTLKRKLLPLLEPSGGGDEQLPSHEQVMRRLAAGSDPWLAACAFYAARQTGIAQLEDLARIAAGSDHPALREEAAALLEDLRKEIPV